MICRGQVWRLVTWVFMPSTSLDIFGILFLFCVLSWASSLESFLGTFRMNVFLFGGMILSDLAGLLVYLVSFLARGTGVDVYLSTYYILLSILLALAMCMPEGQVFLFFVLPIKMKWMGLASAAVWVLEFLTGSFSTKISLLFGIAGFLAFFGKEVFYTVRDAIVSYKRRKDWERRVNRK